jgi:hypothetical protein
LARESEPALLGYNIFLVETELDAMIATEMQMYDFFYEESECENCGLVVGPVEDEFYPAFIVSDQNDISWVVCVECAFPMINPNS